MLKTTEKRKMRLGVHVLLRNTPPNLCLAIPGTLEFQDRVYHSIAFFLSVEYVQDSFLVVIVLNLGQCEFRFLVSLFIFSTVGLADLHRYHVHIPDCYICFVVSAMLSCGSSQPSLCEYAFATSVGPCL